MKGIDIIGHCLQADYSVIWPKTHTQLHYKFAIIWKSSWHLEGSTRWLLDIPSHCCSQSICVYGTEVSWLHEHLPTHWIHSVIETSSKTWRQKNLSVSYLPELFTTTTLKIKGFSGAIYSTQQLCQHNWRDNKSWYHGKDSSISKGNHLPLTL